MAVADFGGCAQGQKISDFLLCSEYIGEMGVRHTEPHATRLL